MISRAQEMMEIIRWENEGGRIGWRPSVGAQRSQTIHVNSTLGWTDVAKRLLISVTDRTIRKRGNYQ